MSNDAKIGRARTVIGWHEPPQTVTPPGGMPLQPVPSTTMHPQQLPPRRVLQQVEPNVYEWKVQPRELPPPAIMYPSQVPPRQPPQDPQPPRYPGLVYRSPVDRGSPQPRLLDQPLMAREAPPLPPDLQPPRVLAPESAPIARPLDGAGAATGSSRRTWLLLSLGTLASGSLGYLFVDQGAPVAAGALALFSSMALVLWCVIRVLG